MFVIKLPNGNLMAPESAVDADGQVVGDAYVEISPADPEYARLAASYQFLRYLEHRLQIEEDRQTHTLPSDPDRLDLLAAKMPQDGTGARLEGDTLNQKLDEAREREPLAHA